MSQIRTWVVRIASVMVLGGTPSVVHAAPFSIESPSYQTRELADAERKEVIAAGAAEDRVRIVRRYERGAGWRYLVHVDGVDDMQKVDQLGAVLWDGERGPKVVDLATGAVAPTTAPPKTTESRSVAKEPTPTDDDAATGTPRRQRKEADGVLIAAVAAHGGVNGGLKLVEDASNLTFQFVREVPLDSGVLKAKHVYRKSGAARRLDVSVQKGNGVDSTTVVSPDGGAWVSTGKEMVPRDAERARDIVGRFAPDQLLRVALGVAADIETAAAWRELQLLGPEGNDLVILRPTDGPTGGLVEVAFSREDHRLRRLILTEGGSETRFFFDDYREVAPGVVVPHESEVQRDGRFAESIQVLGLDISTPIPAALFSATE